MDASPRRHSRTARTVYRSFLLQGCTPREAGNLTAWLVGLRPVAAGWTPAQIDRLLFLAWLYRTRDPSID